MRTFVRAILVSLALTSASVAIACPIDLAPCDEVVTLHDVPISRVQTEDDMLASMVAGEAVLAPLQTVLLDHEGDRVAAYTQGAAPILDVSDVCLDLTDALLALVAKGEGQGEPEEFLQVDTTGTLDPSSGSRLAEPKLALDGYEDR